ncbi:unnamed protein product [Closterium sp. Naga37s-1]|nr:unnamed protein product [Closterium sp. Naga37s-1]
MRDGQPLRARDGQSMPMFRLPCSASHVPPPMFRLPCSASHVPPPMFRLPCSASRVPPPVFRLPCSASRVPPPVFRLPCSASRVPPPVFRLPCSASRVPPPVFRLPCSASRVPPPVFRLPCSASRVPPPVFRLRVFRLPCSASRVPPPVFRLPCSASRVPPPVFRLPCSASRVPPPVFRLPCSASRVPPPVFRLPCSASRVPPPVFRLPCSASRVPPPVFRLPCSASRVPPPVFRLPCSTPFRLSSHCPRCQHGTVLLTASPLSSFSLTPSTVEQHEALLLLSPVSRLPPGGVNASARAAEAVECEVRGVCDVNTCDEHEDKPKKAAQPVSKPTDNGVRESASKSHHSEPATPRPMLKEVGGPFADETRISLVKKLNDLNFSSLEDRTAEGSTEAGEEKKNTDEVSSPAVAPEVPAEGEEEEEDEDDGYLSDDPEERFDPVKAGEIAARAGFSITLLIPIKYEEEVERTIDTVKGLLALWRKYMSAHVLTTTKCQVLLPAWLSKKRYGRLQVTFQQASDANYAWCRRVEHKMLNGVGITLD